jgi:ribosome biogenesis GTPase / thiamine phosphate phosphatase
VLLRVSLLLLACASPERAAASGITEAVSAGLSDMIEEFGWSAELQTAFAPFGAQGCLPARVTAHHRALWRLTTDAGELAGRLSGKFAMDARPGDHPAVGDWLAIAREGATDAVIHGLMPRKSTFTRRAAGDVGIQVVAANIDVAFLVAALNNDLNVRRIERYLVATRDSGAMPVIVLTKADLSDAPEEAAAEVVAIAGDSHVVTLSALTGDGLDKLSPWLVKGATLALLGSSGAGKSTLLNALAGNELMATGAIRQGDERGRHTTTHRELFKLPSGALLVDTPGMRELGLLAVEDALDASFEDVITLFGHCKFGNCKHASEPGCAVLGALKSGALPDERWQAYLKLQRELEFAATREDPAAAFAKRQKWKQVHKDQRAKYKHRSQNEDV